MAKKRSKSRKRRKQQSYGKRPSSTEESLKYDSLEPKQLLATFVVNSLADNFANDGVTTLREAISQAESSGDSSNTITFASSISNGTIQLENELPISGFAVDATSLLIDATGASEITISAQRSYESTPGLFGLPRLVGHRIFDIAGGAGEFQVNTSLTLKNLKLTNGLETENNDSETRLLDNLHSGGAIRFNSTGTLTLDNTTVENSKTEGERASGGGIFAIGDVILTNNSVVQNNSTGIKLQPFRDSGTMALGGGVYSQGTVTVNNSTVQMNRTYGETAPGGGIAARQGVTLNNADILNNYTDGFYAYGGGVYAGGTIPNPAFTIGSGLDSYIPAQGVVTVTNGSLVSGNEAKLRHSKGGGIFGINVDVSDSTVSNNATRSRLSHGGGIYAHNTLDITDSTLANNSALGGTSGTAAFFCTFGTFIAKEAVKQLPVVGQLYSAFAQIQGYITLANTLPGVDVPTIPTNPCPTPGSWSKGGGAFATDITVTNSNITDNKTNEKGGGLLARKSAILVNSNLSRNEADRGGAVSANYLKMTNSLMEDNTSDFVGGAVQAHEADVIDSVVKNNRAEGAGGAFIVDHMNVDNSLFIGNYTDATVSPGGAIDATREVYVHQSQFINNSTRQGDFFLGPSSSPGGAISADVVRTFDSTFEGNYTVGDEANGGAINGRIISATRTTFVGNETRHPDTFGGAISTASIFDGSDTTGVVTIIQSTLTGNRSGGKGGAIHSTDQLVLENSILLENAAVDDGDGTNRGNEFHAKDVRVSSKNIVGEAGDEAVDQVIRGSFSDSGTGGTILTGVPNNVFASRTSFSHGGVNHLAGDHADNGGRRAGGSTLFTGVNAATSIQSQVIESVELSSFSGNPALDAVSIGGLPSYLVDQRGFQRGFDFGAGNGGTDDIGAFERRFSTVVDTHLFDDGGASTTTLAEVILNANSASADEITVTFAPHLSGQTIQLSGSLPQVTSNLVIDATSLLDRLTVRGDGSSRLFDVRSPDYFTVKNLELTNGHIVGNAANSGGAINYEFNGVLTLENTVVFDNSTSGDNAQGGAIFGESVDVVLIDSDVFSNRTTGRSADGGAIFAEDVRLFNSAVHTNNTRYEDTNGAGAARGGGIYAKQAVSLYDGSVVRLNSTRSDGGAGGGIYANQVDVFDSTVLNNRTEGSGAGGGGIFATGEVVLERSVLQDNRTESSSSPGGGIASDGSVTITASHLHGNYTSGNSSDGGAIFTNTGLQVDDSLVNANYTLGQSSDGGGLAVDGTATITNSTIAGNWTGGAGALAGGMIADRMTLTNSTMTGNSTGRTNSNFGGAYAVLEANLRNSIVLGNYSGSSVSPVHDIGSNYTINRYASINGTTSSATPESVFANTGLVQTISSSGALSSNTGGFTGGSLTDNGGRFPSVALEAHPSNPAINGTVDPEALWSFEGNNYVDDGFGTNDGTFEGGIIPTSDGLVGRGLRFTGDGTKYIQLPETLNVDGATSHTLEVWVKIPEVGTDGLVAGERVGPILANFGNTSRNVNWEIHDDGQMRIFWNNGQRNLFGTTDLRDDQWHHLAFVRDRVNDQFRFYLDGEVELVHASAGTDILPFTQPHRIGQDNRSGTPVPFHGTIDELTMHAGALSAEEIKVRAKRFDVRGEEFHRLALPAENTSIAWKTRPPHLDMGAFESPVLEDQSLLVTTLDDVVDGADNVTSLREAILFANSRDADGIDGDEDTIRFDPSLDGGRIVLQGGQLEITEALNLGGDTLGGEVQVTIDADDLSRVLHYSGTSGDLDIRGLHLTNGLVSNESGGGIRFDSSGELVLRRSRISGNVVIGNNSTGGGVHSNGSLRVLSSTIDGNTTSGLNSHGGGAYANGLVRLLNATVFGNQTFADDSEGGGVHGNDVLSTNSTISKNLTHGYNSIGGGVYGTTSVRLSNTIMLGNETLAPGVGDDELNSGSTFGAFYGHNLVGIDSNAFDTSSTSFSAVENARMEDVFQLGHLEAVPESVPTMSLRPWHANPALDSGDDSLTNNQNLNEDARLSDRIIDLPSIAGSAVDLGAYELRADVEEVRGAFVTTSLDVVDPFDYHTSLREAISYALDDDAEIFIHNIITFADGDGEHFAAPQTISLSTDATNGGEFVVNDDITIVGPGETKLTIDALGNSRIFSLGSTDAAEYYIGGLTLKGGDTGGSGGAILLSDPNDRLVIDGARFTENFANGGGAISVTGSQFEIFDSSFVGNTANFSGSAIHSLGNALGWIASTTISGNVSGNSSGAILVQAGNGETGSVHLRNVTVADNIGNGVQAFAFTGGTASFSAANTIFANSSGVNVIAGGSGTGVFLSQGNNISDDGSSGFLSSDLTNTDPQLTPIDLNADQLFHGLQPTSPAVDAGSNNQASDINGTPLATDQRELDRFFDALGSGTATVDIGAIEVNQTLDLIAPTVESVVFNGGDDQRSVLTEIKVTFSEFVNVFASSFIVKNDDTGVCFVPDVLVEGVDSKTVATLTFSGDGITAGSLPDGNYTMSILETVTDTSGNQLDGDVDGNEGGDATDEFFRFYGDTNGDRTVNIFDLLTFRRAYNSIEDYNPDVDFDGNGIVNVFDLLEFRRRYLETI